MNQFWNTMKKWAKATAVITAQSLCAAMIVAPKNYCIWEFFRIKSKSKWLEWKRGRRRAPQYQCIAHALNIADVGAEIWILCIERYLSFFYSNFILSFGSVFLFFFLFHHFSKESNSHIHNERKKFTNAILFSVERHEIFILECKR